MFPRANKKVLVGQKWPAGLALATPDVDAQKGVGWGKVCGLRGVGGGYT
jgi:hypothetical protein